MKEYCEDDKLEFKDIDKNLDLSQGLGIDVEDSGCAWEISSSDW